MAPARNSPRSRGFSRAVLVALGFGLLGYVVYVYANNPSYAQAAAVCATIFVGARAATVRSGAVRGAVFGAVAGIGIFGAWSNAFLRAVGVADSQPASQPTSLPAPQPATAPAPTQATTQPASASRPIDPAAIRAEVERQLPFMAFKAIVVTALMCGVVGAVFAHLAAARRARMRHYR